MGTPTDREIALAAARVGDPAARAAYLDGACGGDAALRQRVEALLVPSATAGESADEDDPVALLDPPTRPGSLGRLGHYEVLQELGQGASGIVYRAFDDVLQRPVAVKVLDPRLAVTSPARKRFLREARSGAAVRHENVVQVYEVGEKPLPYLAMEFVPGETLQQRLDRTGPLDPVEAVSIARQVAAGLAAAHATGLVHRDIKPGNILIEGAPHHRVKITDFGLARVADDASLSQSGYVAGTPLYMSPEQARGEPLDGRADLFSLGSVLYAMLTGRPPFRAGTTLAVLRRVAEEDPRPIREVIPEVPEWLADVVRRLHAKKPADRFQSAEELVRVLDRCLAALRDDGTATPPVLRLRRSGRRARWAAVAGGLACLAVAAPAVLLILSRRDQPGTAAAPPPSGQPAAEGTPAEFTNRFGMKFVLIPAGKSRLGGGDGRPGEEVVEFAEPFYLGKYEVTQEEWAKVLGPGHNPSRLSRTGEMRDRVAGVPDEELKRFPVDAVSWNQCQHFLRELNRQAGEDGWVYRLPRSAEWEYACRGGPGLTDEELGFDFYLARPSKTLSPQDANTKASGLDRTCRVGSYPANRLGLHDMHGNVFELCDDAGDTGETPPRRLCGGCWNDPEDFCRAAHRGLIGADVPYDGGGLRLARVPARPAGPPR